MKRALVMLCSALAAFWALFAFAASNSPAEVQQRAQGWLALPVIRDIPDAAVAFAGSPIVLAATFFGLGIAGGWKLRGRRKRPKGDRWWEELGTELSLLAYEVRDAAPLTDAHRLNAKINIMALRLHEKGFEFPNQANGFASTHSLLPYLSQVSTWLISGKVEHAREVAAHLAKRPPS